MSQGFSGNNERPSSNADGEVTSQATELLRSVLETTLASSTRSITNDELNALRDVAIDQGQELPLSRVAELLVSKLLRTRFGDAASSKTVEGDPHRRTSPFDNMAKSIAETLCNDPESAKRLTQLWQLLKESAA